MNLSRRWDGLLVLFECDCVAMVGVDVVVDVVAAAAALFDACEAMS